MNETLQGRGGDRKSVNSMVDPLFHQCGSISVLFSPSVTTGICELPIPLLGLINNVF
jgi:hypothetical protein